MIEVDRTKDRTILPQDLLHHYVSARRNIYPWISSSAAVPDLTAPGSKGFEYPGEAMEIGYNLPYRYRLNVVIGKGTFAGREVNFSRYDEKDLITWYSYMSHLTEEGVKRGEEFVYGFLLPLFLGKHADQVRLGKNVQFERQLEQGSVVYKGKGSRAGRSWHDRETIQLNGILLYIGQGDGTYDPDARKRAIIKHDEAELI